MLCIQAKALAACFLFAAALARAQDAPLLSGKAVVSQPPTDEIIVRGKRGARLRIELQAARERVWDIFNEINSNDDFDISCTYARRTGSHITKRVCRPSYVDRATSQVGKDLTRRIQRRCDPASASFGECLEQALQTSGAEAQAQIGRMAYMGQQMDEEFQRLARSNADLAAAILNYRQKEREYEDLARDGKRSRKKARQESREE